jgi:hypothetical protein
MEEPWRARLAASLLRLRSPACDARQRQRAGTVQVSSVRPRSESDGNRQRGKAHYCSTLLALSALPLSISPYDLRITSSSSWGSRRFTAVQRVWTYFLERVWTALNCNRNCNSVMSCRSWRTMPAQRVADGDADDNRNDHVVTPWLQARLASADTGHCGSAAALRCCMR